MKEDEQLLIIWMKVQGQVVSVVYIVDDGTQPQIDHGGGGGKMVS